MILNIFFTSPEYSDKANKQIEENKEKGRYAIPINSGFICLESDLELGEKLPLYSLKQQKIDIKDLPGKKIVKQYLNSKNEKRKVDF